MPFIKFKGVEKMLNNVVLMGRLTADPVLKVTTSGKDVCSFSIAVDRAYQKQGETRKTDFINVVAWETGARFVSRYFKKGQLIAIVGSIQTHSYEDSQGNKRYVFEILAKEVSFCGSKNEGNTQASTASAPSDDVNGGFSTATSADFEDITDDEDLPF